MNVFDKILLELPVIKNTLAGYDHTASAYTILPSLEESSKTRKKDSVLYCIGVMIEWYNRNMGDIHTITFRDDVNEHQRIFKLLTDVKEELQELKDDITEINNIDLKPKVFLSHRSTDKKYGDALQKFIVGLGVEPNQLIYTSHPLHKIPMGKNIYEYLRENINSKIFMIILWSDEYLDSPACLNEMGAAWVVQCDYTNIYVPNFSFGNPKYHMCAVDTNKMGAVLNGDKHCKQAMIELKNQIQDLFNLENDEAKSAYLLDEFIDDIKED